MGVPTSHGIGLGAPVKSVYGSYGWPDSTEIQGPSVVLNFNERYHTYFASLNNKITGIAVFLRESERVMFFDQGGNMGGFGNRGGMMGGGMPGMPGMPGMGRMGGMSGMPGMGRMGGMPGRGGLQGFGGGGGKGGPMGGEAD
jgi:hypothetical protein